MGRVLLRRRSRRLPGHLRGERRHRRITRHGCASPTEPAAAAPQKPRQPDIRERDSRTRVGFQPADHGTGRRIRRLRRRRRSRPGHHDARRSRLPLSQRRREHQSLDPCAHRRVSFESQGDWCGRARDQRLGHAVADGAEWFELRVAERVRATFGLGGDARADRIEVEWPSGAKQTFTEVASDQVVSIDEASGLQVSARPSTPPSPGAGARPR